MNTALLCLGGNLGNRLQTLEACRDAIKKSCGTIVKVSKIYETEAWGSDSEKKFLNQVVQINTKHTAPLLLKKLLGIEKKLGRTRTAERNSDRTVDVDILFFNSHILTTKEVEIPHPRLHLRNFVLKPLMDVAPELKHPVLKKSIRQLYKASGDKLKVYAYQPIRYICIEGNIGSGKTTLAQELGKHLQATFLPEQFEKNSLLPLFYENPKKFAFLLEYSFLLSRYEQIAREFRSNDTVVVSDYSIYKCLWFAKVNLSKKDYLFFEKHFKAVEAQLPKPDLMIYLHTPTKNLVENIRRRGRSYEQAIPVKYLEKVSKEYEKGLQKHKGVLRMDIKSYHPELTAKMIQRIKKSLG